MKQNLMRLLPAAAIAAALALGACSGKKGGNEATADSIGSAFTTDSVHWADSLVLGGCKANVTIDGQYPTTEGRLSDSVRAWLGARLSYGMTGSGKPMFTPTAAELASREVLAARTGKVLLDSARSDFRSFAADSITTNYEYIYSFMPIYRTDSLLTYQFNGYCYLGGAHGGALAYGQTFDANSGAQLNAANMIAAAGRAKLIDMLRRGLWEQYFKANSAPGQNLRDNLLIDPDTLPLPAMPPICLKDGVAFTYQQYEIACYAAGMPSCTIPYDSIKPLMTTWAAGLVSK